MSQDEDGEVYGPFTLQDAPKRSWRVLGAFQRILAWLWGEAKEKLNFVGTVREILKQGRKYGLRFVIAAITWEIIEDIVFPLISWHYGHPELIAVFLVLHFEPIVYPVFFWCFRTYDRMRGREPWDPARPRVSTGTRSWAKVLSHRLLAAGLFWMMLARFSLPFWLLTVYLLVMIVFKYVHERIWHDSSYGITLDGVTVLWKRTFAKAVTYRLASTAVMAMVFQGFLGGLHAEALVSYQLVSFVAYMALEAAWAHSAWGIRPASN